MELGGEDEDAVRKEGRFEKDVAPVFQRQNHQRVDICKVVDNYYQADSEVLPVYFSIEKYLFYSFLKAMISLFSDLVSLRGGKYLLNFC